MSETTKSWPDRRAELRARQDRALAALDALADRIRERRQQSKQTAEGPES